MCLSASAHRSKLASVSLLRQTPQTSLSSSQASQGWTEPSRMHRPHLQKEKNRELIHWSTQKKATKSKLHNWQALLFAFHRSSLKRKEPLTIKKAYESVWPKHSGSVSAAGGSSPAAAVGVAATHCPSAAWVESARQSPLQSLRLGSVALRHSPHSTTLTAKKKDNI